MCKLYFPLRDMATRCAITPPHQPPVHILKSASGLLVRADLPTTSTMLTLTEIVSQSENNEWNQVVFTDKRHINPSIDSIAHSSASRPGSSSSITPSVPACLPSLSSSWPPGFQNLPILAATLPLPAPFQKFVGTAKRLKTVTQSTRHVLRAMLQIRKEATEERGKQGKKRIWPSGDGPHAAGSRLPPSPLQRGSGRHIDWTWSSLCAKCTNSRKLQSNSAMLHRKQIPTNNGLLPDDVCRAERIGYELSKRADIGFGDGANADGTFWKIWLLTLPRVVC